MPYDIEAIRRNAKKQVDGRIADPDEFRPAKATSGETIKYRFFILPPLAEGDELKSGTVKKSMMNFFIPHAEHWVNSKPYPCPRVWDESECPICQFGFDLLRSENDKDARTKIRNIWMPSKYYTVNIFFTNWKGNPEDLRNKVKWWNAPKTCVDHWIEALYRDDKGDEEEPQAHGVFFDENAAFIYQLEVRREGIQNSYKTSKFITRDGEPIPMIGERGKPNAKAIEMLLKLRHNLWTKIQEPNIEEINKLYLFMTKGADDGFDVDEYKQAKAQTSSEPAVSESKGESKSAPDAADEPDDDLSAELPFDMTDQASDDDGDDDAASEINALLDQLSDD